MEARTCPHCNYKYSVGEYYKRLSFKTVWSEWNCHNCGKPITFSTQRRLLLGLPLVLLYFIIALAVSNLEMNIFLWLICGLVMVAGTLLIFLLDSFKKVS